MAHSSTVFRMNRIPRPFLHGLAAVLLGFLGWNAFQPVPESTPTAFSDPASDTPTPPDRSLPPGEPHLTHLVADRILTPGQRMTVQGSVSGGTGAQGVTLSLEGPDGAVASVALPSTPNAEQGFTIQHPTPALAPGSYAWKLRLASSADPILLGAQVLPPDLPRVLILLDFPTLEGTRLQQWFSDARSPVTTRIRISTDRHRIASSTGFTNDLAELDATTLAPFDVVVAHESALDRLRAAELAALDAAVRQHGLGLLVFGPPAPTAESAAPPVSQPRVEVTSHSSPTLSRRLHLRRSTDPAAENRPARVHLWNGSSPEFSVAIAPAEMEVPPAGRVLARDSLDRAIVVSTPLGRGRWLRSLVLDSWRWRQQGATEDYARFWSALLTEAARPLSAPRGRMEGAAPSTPDGEPPVNAPQASGSWSLAGRSHLFFVDHPLSLAWLGDPHAPLPSAAVQPATAPSEPPAALHLTRHPSEPSQATAVFWPSHAGWHTVRAQSGGPELSFYVHSAESLPAVEARRRSEETGRPHPAGLRKPAIPEIGTSALGRILANTLAFLLFVATTAGLWIVPRR